MHRILYIIFLIPIIVNAGEREYQERFCAGVGGQVEFVLPDRTRVDCLTERHAIEVDFARKWAEAIGQSLHYAKMTGKAPGVLLIVDGESDQKYVDRLYGAINRWHLPIQVWLLDKTE